MFKKNDKVGIVALSNPLKEDDKYALKKLILLLENMGLIPVVAEYISENENKYFTGKEKAENLLKLYRDKNIKGIFDVSGGNISNEVLNYLDYDIISKHYKPFFGYSDLTVVINSIYTMCKKCGYLYQVRNLVSSYKEIQYNNFFNSFFMGDRDIFDFKYEFIKGNELAGEVIGGNIRCFLKLAGTKFMPDLKNKVLFLESRSGGVDLMMTFFNQLLQMGVFGDIKGLILGRFSSMEREDLRPSINEIVLQAAQDYDFPIIKTSDIGHNQDSKCIIIGKKYVFKNNRVQIF